MTKRNKDIWINLKIFINYEKYMKKFHKQNTQIKKILDRLSLKYHWEDTDEIIRHKVIRGEW